MYDVTHCLDFCADCPMKCYRAELEIDLRSKWWEHSVKVPLSYAHLYGWKGVQEMRTTERIEKND